MERKRPDGRAAGCEACHSVNDWHDLTKFDHDQTAYPLIGTHKGVACIDCHKPPNLETTLRHVSFKDAPQVCASCHEDPHARQFARDGKDPGCEQCHRPLQWRPSLFDHETSAFSLKGAHQQVACKSCHTNLKDVGGKQVLFYAPTPKQCEACHGAQIPKQSSKLLPRSLLFMARQLDVASNPFTIIRINS